MELSDEAGHLNGLVSVVEVEMDTIFENAHNPLPVRIAWQRVQMQAIRQMLWVMQLHLLVQAM